MKFKKIKYSIPAVLLLVTTYVSATTLKEVVQHTMTKNPEVISVLKNNEAFKYYIDEEKAGYYPTLDLTAYIGTKQTNTDPKNSSKSTTNQDGYNGQIDFEQLLYDGGLTPGLVEEAKRKQSSNELKNRNRIENIMYESISAYLSMVKADEKKLLTQQNISIYDEYMARAKELEDISGESLNRIQVSAKLHFSKNKLLEETKNKKRALSNFEKSVGMSPEGFICRPNANPSLIPDKKQKAIEYALKNNYEILEQIENIKEQRAVVRQSKSEFLPSLKFKAQAILDENILNNDTQTDVYSTKIELTYNIFNGKKDDAVKQREITFLQESQKSLDSITKDVIDRLTVAYDKYQISKEQINELKLYLSYNNEIISIYKDQFEGGTREFIDVLGAETDSYNASLSLVDVEHDFIDAYYEIFSILSNLNATVLTSENQVCQEMKIMTKSRAKKTPSIDELSDLLEKEPSAKEKKQKMQIKESSRSLNDAIKNEFAREIQLQSIRYNDKTMTLRVTSKTTDENKELLKGIFPRFAKVTKEFEPQISEVRVEGHSSSRYMAVDSIEEKFELNKQISLQRANEMLNYATSLEINNVVNNIDFIKNTYKVYGMSSFATIKNSDGSENEELSKRVEFVVALKNI